VTRKELLAVVSALKNFHSYLNGQEVLLRTDNAAVSWLKNLKMLSGQIARWLQEI
jgi:ribonuclease HI